MSLLTVTPIAVANLCVAYVKTAQRDAAEVIIKRVEGEEEELIAHVCNSNLTLIIVRIQRRSLFMDASLTLLSGLCIVDLEITSNLV